MALENGIAYLKAHPKLALAGGGIIAAGFLYSQMRPSPTATTGGALDKPAGNGNSVANPLGGTQAGTIAGVAYVDRVTNLPKVPAKGILQAIRLKADGTTYTTTYKKVTDPTRTCGPGYQLVVQSSGAIRCAAIDERDVKNKGQLTEAPKPVTKAKAGEGWESVHGLQSWGYRGPDPVDLHFQALDPAGTRRARAAFNYN